MARAQEMPAPTPEASDTPEGSPFQSPAPVASAPPVPALEVCATASAGGAAVPGATVILLFPDGRAAALTAGSDGCARLETLAAGLYKVTVAAAGTKPADFSIAVPSGGGAKKTVSLELAAAATQEMDIEESREQPGETRHVITPDEAASLPGTQGDALKAIQDLPGTARAPFGLGVLIVRGSDPQDTTVYLDGQLIPQLYHFGGITSVIATEALSSIDFLPGGFGVRYGRAMGGVVDVSTRPGHDDRYSGLLDANIFDAEAQGEGPIGEGAANGRLLGVVRRSYIDAVLPALVPSDLLTFTVAPRYYDYLLRYDAPLAASGLQAHIVAYGSDDELQFLIANPQGPAGEVRGNFFYHTLFHRLQVPVALPLANGWILSAVPGLGYQRVEIVASSIADAVGDRTDFTGRFEARGPVTPWANLVVGIDAAAMFNHFSVSFPQNEASQDGISSNNVVASRTYPTTQLGLFAEGTVHLAQQVTLVPGVRVDGYGPQNQYSFDPRVAARWEPEKGWFAKSYAGIYHQPPQFQDWDPSIGNPHLPIEEAWQAGLGGGHDFELLGKTHVESELFYKWEQNLTVQQPAPAGSLTQVTTLVGEGLGRSYGLELLIKRELTEKLYGFVAYTLSRSERTDPYTPGGWYLFDYDQTHILTLIAGYKLPYGFEVGSRFRYTTGDPQTGVIGAIYDADRDVYVPVTGPINNQRLPAFYQLDVRIDKRWQFSGWKLGAYLDVQNVTDHPNPEAVSYDFNYQQRYYVTGLPILPAIGLRAEF